jgi:hypothetical protein
MGKMAQVATSNLKSDRPPKMAAIFVDRKSCANIMIFFQVCRRRSGQRSCNSPE